nr:MAG TPA: hypothetical protein [Caudoviricetes sp.]
MGTTGVTHPVYCNERLLREFDFLTNYPKSYIL